LFKSIAVTVYWKEQIRS